MTILIVDDLASARRYHRAGIKAHAPWPDSAIIDCETLDQAIHAAHHGPVDMVVLDLHLSGQDMGVATLRRFLAESGVHPSLVYVVTAESDNPLLVTECMDMGVASVSNSGQAPWHTPPGAFTDAQLSLLDERIGVCVGQLLDVRLERMQREQAERDQLQRAAGVMMAVRTVGLAVAGALGAWLLTFAPGLAKTMLQSVMQR